MSALKGVWVTDDPERDVAPHPTHPVTHPALIYRSDEYLEAAAAAIRHQVPLFVFGDYPPEAEPVWYLVYVAGVGVWVNQKPWRPMSAAALRWMQLGVAIQQLRSHAPKGIQPKSNKELIREAVHGSAKTQTRVWNPWVKIGRSAAEHAAWAVFNWMAGWGMVTAPKPSGDYPWPGFVRPPAVQRKRRSSAS